MSSLIRGRLRVSLRLLLFAPVILGAWLAWHLHVIQSRHDLKRLIIERNGTVIEDDDHGIRQFYRTLAATDPTIPKIGMEIPRIRRIMGDRAAAQITVSDSFPPELKERIKATFPECDFNEVVEEPY